MPQVLAAGNHFHSAGVVRSAPPYKHVMQHYCWHRSLILGAGAPEVLQLVGVRLHVQLWQQSNQGRRGPAWSRLQVMHCGWFGESGPQQV